MLRWFLDLNAKQATVKFGHEVDPKDISFGAKTVRPADHPDFRTECAPLTESGKLSNKLGADLGFCFHRRLLRRLSLAFSESVFRCLYEPVLQGGLALDRVASDLLIQITGESKEYGTRFL